MKQAISKLLGLKPTDSTGKLPKATKTVSGADARDSTHTIEDNSDNGTRRQLVQMLLRDGLRKHGVPPGWVECRMLLVNSRSRGPGMHVRLVMRRWDLRLLTYAHAFEGQLLSAIREFAPESTGWLHGVSWEFDVGTGCPYPDMPDPAVWREAAAALPPAPTAAAATVATAAAAPAVAAATAAGTAADPHSNSDADVLQDLERMFAIRDANMEQQAFADTASGDFQHTEPFGRL